MSDAFWQNLPALVAALAAGIPSIIAAIISAGNRKIHKTNSAKIDKVNTDVAKVANSVVDHVKECTASRQTK